MHFLQWNRYCVYTLGIEDKKGKCSRIPSAAGPDWKTSPASPLWSSHSLSYAFLWRPLVENCILGIWNHPQGTTQAWHCLFIESHWILGEGKIGNFKWINPQLTGHLVHQDAWGNDASVLREELLQFFLSHGFRQATDVQICISDGGRAWTRIGNLQREDKAGQVKAQKQHVLSRNFAQQTRPCVPFVQVEKRRAGAVHNFRQR